METVTITSVSDAGDNTNYSVTGTVDGRTHTVLVAKSVLDGAKNKFDKMLIAAQSLQQEDDKTSPSGSDFLGSVTLSPASTSSPAPTPLARRA